MVKRKSAGIRLSLYHARNKGRPLTSKQKRRVRHKSKGKFFR